MLGQQLGRPAGDWEYNVYVQSCGCARCRVECMRCMCICNLCVYGGVRVADKGLGVTLVLVRGEPTWLMEEASPLRWRSQTLHRERAEEADRVQMVYV